MKINELHKRFLGFALSILIAVSSIAPVSAAGGEKGLDVAQNATDEEIVVTQDHGVADGGEDINLETSSFAALPSENSLDFNRFIKDDEFVNPIEYEGETLYFPILGEYKNGRGTNESGQAVYRKSYNPTTPYKHRMVVDGVSTDTVLYCLSNGKDAPKTISFDRTEEADESILKIVKLGYPFKKGADYGVTDIELEWATAVALYMNDGRLYERYTDEDGNEFAKLLDEKYDENYFGADIELEELKAELDELGKLEGQHELEIDGKKVFPLIINFMKSSLDKDLEMSKDVAEQALKLYNLSLEILNESKNLDIEDVLDVEVSGKKSYFPNNNGEVFGPFTAKAPATKIKATLKESGEELVIVDENGELVEEDDQVSVFYVKTDKVLNPGEEVNVYLESVERKPLGLVFTEDFENLSHASEENDDHPHQKMFFATEEKMIGSFNFDVTEVPTKDVELEKQDTENKTPVEGAVISVSKIEESGEEVLIRDDYTTDKEGRVVMSNLTTGNYVYHEVSAPEGYILDENKYNFSIELKDGELVVIVEGEVKEEAPQLILENKKIEEPTPEPVKKHPVQITKTDITDAKPVPGATIEIYKEDKDQANGLGEMVHKSITGKDGKTELVELESGRYKFKETIAPKGYILSEEIVSFTINEDGTVEGRVTMTNAPEIKLTKTDITDGKPVPGATIEVYEFNKDTDKLGKKVFSGITNKEGIIVLPKLEAGNYAFKETIAPKGYVLSEETIQFTIKEDFTVEGKTSMTNAPEKHVIIHKKDLTDGKPVEGAKIKVWSEDPNVKNFKPVEKISNKDGELFVVITEAGKYKFKETIAPDGYILNEEEFEFEVEFKDGEFKIYGDTTIKNERKEVLFDVDLYKKDFVTNENLANAEFKLYDKDKKELENKVVFNENGKAVIKGLKAGDYLLRETKAPLGYKLNTDFHAFTIKEDGKIIMKNNDNFIDLSKDGSIILYNERLDLIFNKIDGETKKPLEGAEFKLMIRKNGKLEDFGKTVKSDKKGRVNIGEGVSLNPGEYALQETKAPEGYELLKDPISFTILKNGKISIDTTIANFLEKEPTPPVKPEEPKPTPVEPTPVEPTPTPEDEVVVPEDTVVKPDGITPTPEYEEYEEYEEEDEEVVVNEAVKTGQGVANLAFVQTMLLILSVAFVSLGIALKAKERYRK